MNSAQKPLPTPTQAEELLASLEGVVSAHVVTEAGGRIVEIHVLATPDHHPKQVVRNVESALSAGLGIGIDRRVVSVAQIRSSDFRQEEPPAGSGTRDTGSDVRMLASPEALQDEEVSDPNPGRGRLEYVRYESRRDVESCTVEVVLRDGALEIKGRGTSPDTAAGRAEAAGRAVMDAVGQARPDLRLSLDGAALSTSRGRTFVIVSAHAVQDRDTVSLAGAAAVSRSPEEAAILAALQATNRWSG